MQHTSNKNRAVVVIPTYNEARNIRTVIEQVQDLPGEVHVVVVDDGSPDGTAERVRKIAERRPGAVSLIERPHKMGLGSAYLCGFRRALDEGYAFICEMDADLSHNPADLPRLIEPVRTGRADMTIGSRYLDGVRVVDWPLGRLILSYGASMYTRLITRLPVHDVTAGFVCYHRRVLEALDFDRITSNGYSFQVEMKYRIHTRGFSLLEVPIVFIERAEGQSKMSKAIVREAACKVWELRLRHLLGRL